MSTYAFAYIIDRSSDDDREGLIPRPGGHWLDVYLEGQALPRGASVVGTVDLVRRTWSGRPPWPFTADDMARAAACAVGLVGADVSDHEATRDGAAAEHPPREVHERHLGDDGEERCGDVMADDRGRRRLCGGCSHIDAPDSARRGCGEVLGLRDVTP